MTSYDERLKKVAVLGAAGKMGSGIVLLTALEMADRSLKPENKEKTFVLYAIDLNDEALNGLLDYLRAQILKAAEKKTVALRQTYAHRTDLIENGEIIEQYVHDVLRIVRPVTTIESAYDANLILEAVSENQSLKIKLLGQIDQHNPHKPWYFTNTSSVPIHLIEQGAGLHGRVLGFHFYNPPAVQKLVELIQTPNTLPEVRQFALDLAKAMKKVVVPSNDFAGFIGNGHFMRDALFGIRKAVSLSSSMPLYQAIFIVNKISQDYLVRPMGIFQLIDYVGIDVVQFIMQVMNPYLPDEDLHAELLDRMIQMGIKGGQYANGTQKDGFFKYDKGAIVAVYDIENQDYVPMDNFIAAALEWIGPTPDGHMAWKNAIKLADKETFFGHWFNALKTAKTNGAMLAIEYGKNADAIGRKLVTNGVANNNEDVNTVMLTGFYHAYGPVNNFFA